MAKAKIEHKTAGIFTDPNKGRLTYESPKVHQCQVTHADGTMEVFDLQDGETHQLKNGDLDPRSHK